MTPLGLRWRADELRAVRMGFTEAWLVGRRILRAKEGHPRTGKQTAPCTKPIKRASQPTPILSDSFNARQRLVSVKRRWRG